MSALEISEENIKRLKEKGYDNMEDFVEDNPDKFTHVEIGIMKILGLKVSDRVQKMKDSEFDEGKHCPTCTCKEHKKSA